MSDETDPDVGELVQHEGGAPHPYPPVPVDVQGPVKVQTLPAQTGSIGRKNVVDTDATRITKADPRRSILRIWATDQPIYVGYTQAEALGGQAAKLPINTILPISNLNEVWVRSATPGQATDVSFVNDQWTQ